MGQLRTYKITSAYNADGEVAEGQGAADTPQVDDEIVVYIESPKSRKKWWLLWLKIKDWFPTQETD